jgi:hypothetical protein
MIGLKPQPQLKQTTAYAGTRYVTLLRTLRQHLDRYPAKSHASPHPQPFKS